jgi:hypothetical protein
MRRLLLAFALLSVLGVLGSDSSREYDDQIAMEGIEGTWRPVERNANRNVRQKLPASWPLTFRNGTIIRDLGNEVYVRGTYSVDQTCYPHRMTWANLNMIWEVNGNTLRIAYRLDLPGLYPQGFDPDEDVVVNVYKRVR